MFLFLFLFLNLFFDWFISIGEITFLGYLWMYPRGSCVYEIAGNIQELFSPLQLKLNRVLCWVNFDYIKITCVFRHLLALLIHFGFFQCIVLKEWKCISFLWTKEIFLYKKESLASRMFESQPPRCYIGIKRDCINFMFFNNINLAMVCGVGIRYTVFIQS